MPRSLHQRLSALLLIGSGAVLLIAGIFLDLQVSRRFEARLDRQLTRGLEELTAQLDAPGSELGEPLAGELLAGSFYQVWGERGEILTRSASLGVASQLERDGLAGSSPRFRDVELADGRRGRQAQVALDRVALDREPPVTVVLAVPRGEHDRRRAAVRRLLATAAAVFLAVLVLIVHAGVGAALRPLAALSRQLATLDTGRLAAGLEVPRATAELRPLIGRLEELLGRAGAALDRERRMTGDIAHELRTPVAELRNLAEVGARWPDDEAAVEAFLDDVGEISRQMETTMRDLQALARSESGLEPVEVRDVAVSDVVERIWPTIEASATPRQLTCTFEVPRDLRLRTDPDKLQLILLNLLANAVTYSRPGGTVRLVAARGADGRVTLSVSNPPRDLSREDLPRMFDRFWRKDLSRSGQNAGLGLALVRSFAGLLDLGIETSLEDGVLSVVLAARGDAA